MSETTTTNTNGACELVLDYVYGELDEARKRTFEEHLPACARCQQEVASFGRVRTAAKRVMPAVEPPAALTGALHAQLMHAAAQRKPRRGVLLAFPRKIVEHPALSAAAMFVLVGGAIAINWSRGKMAMPAAEHLQSDAPKPTEVVAAKTEAAPAAEPMVPASKTKEAENGVAKSGDKRQAAFDDAKDNATLALQTPKGSYAVMPSAAHRGVVATAAPAPKKMATPRMKNIATDGKLAKYDTGNAFGSKDEAGIGDLEGATVGGVAGGAPSGAGGGENEKSSAPAELSRKSVAGKAPAREDKPAAHGYATATPTAPQPAPPPAAATAPSSTRDAYYRSQAQGTQVVQKPATNARNYDVLHKQADEYAKSNRCDDAIKLYQELEKSSQYLSPTERVNWVRCLTQRGRQEEAQQRLDELKQEKRVTNAQIQDVEKQLNEQRARRVDNKKAKKAAPADRAPAQAESVQQKRAAEPAPQSPPDSTNTKVKPSSAY